GARGAPDGDPGISGGPYARPCGVPALSWPYTSTHHECHSSRHSRQSGVSCKLRLTTDAESTVRTARRLPHRAHISPTAPHVEMDLIVEPTAPGETERLPQFTRRAVHRRVEVQIEREPGAVSGMSRRSRRVAAPPRDEVVVETLLLVEAPPCAR